MILLAAASSSWLTGSLAKNSFCYYGGPSFLLAARRSFRAPGVALHSIIFFLINSPDPSDSMLFKRWDFFFKPQRVLSSERVFCFVHLSDLLQRSVLLAADLPSNNSFSSSALGII